MEDIKKRVEFENPFIQQQAVWKLYGEVEKKKCIEKITDQSPEVAELKLLWEMLAGERCLVAEAAGDALVQLVMADVCEFTYILHGVLNRVPSSKSLTGVVRALGQLLAVEAIAIQQAEGEYTCPHALRAPTHPYITVLIHRPASWPLLTSQVEQLALHHDVRVQTLSPEMLRPFVSFVLLDPSPSRSDAALLRNQLQQLLLRVSRVSAAQDKWLALLVDALPCYQVNTADTVFQLVSHVRQLLEALVDRDGSKPIKRSGAGGDQTGTETGESNGHGTFVQGGNNVTGSEELRRVAETGVALVLPAVRHQLDVRNLMESIFQVVQRFPKSLGRKAVLGQLCHVLLELGSFCPPIFLQLVERVVVAGSAFGSGVGAAVLVLPLLQFLSVPLPPSAEGSSGASVFPRPQASHRQLTSLAAAALAAVEASVNKRGSGNTDCNNGTAKCESEKWRKVFAEDVQTSTVSNLLSSITTTACSTRQWLKQLSQYLAEKTESFGVSRQITCVVAAVLVVYPQTDVTSLALDVSVHIARLDSTKAPWFLSLVLYCLGKERDPRCRLLLLEHIPLMAQHKLCVPPILKTIQAFMMSPRLRPLAIRLITSLWQRQDRCFPHLLKAIGEEIQASAPGFSPSLAAEVLLARAAAVKEICQHRPEQHGEELLPILSMILQRATDKHGAAPSALVLEGLYSLCEAEVIDIQSAWSVMEKQMTTEKRSVVLVKICKLFSLVPSLEVKTANYEKFKENCVSMLWLYTQNSDPLVQGAAFQALASISLACFKVSHLPVKVCEDLHCQAEMARQQQVVQQQLQVEGIKQQQLLPEITVDTLFNFIPGICFTRLLQTVPQGVLDDFQGFLSALVGKEVEDLPRGLYHSATRRHGLSGHHDRAMAYIPAFLSQQHNSTRQTGLRPSLAAALLFCYNPPVETGRDGRPRKHYLVRHGKLFMDTFKTLLNEVPVQPSEWHRSLLMPQAWVSFVDRLCLSLIESRCAELDLQVKHGHISEDQREEKTRSAWLLVRDNVADMLKVASKGNPCQQANSVLALAGLANFTCRHVGSLELKALQDSEVAGTEHASHAHWLTMAVDTVLTIWDVKYTPRGKLLGFAQQRSAEDRRPASVLAQSVASVSVAILTPCLLSGQGDLVLTLLPQLTHCLPGRPGAGDSSGQLFHAGVGLGMTLARLFEEHFSDVAGKEGMLAVWQAMGALEDCCFDSKQEHRAGCLLGLGLALTGLCQESSTDCRVHVSSMWDRLGRLLDNLPQDDPAYQALCFCLACASGSAYCADILKMEQINATLHQLEMTHKKHPEVAGSAIASGMLCFSLSKMGHPAVTALRQTLTSEWLKALTTQDTPPREKIASLNGLMALIGSEQTLMVVQSGVSLTSSDIKASEVIEAVTRSVQSDPDLGIQSNAAWMLGHLHLSACTVASDRASVPTTFGYLPEASILRAAVDLLLEAGKQGPECVSWRHVKVALSALQDDVRRVLPPLNWAGVLSPLMRMPFGDECRLLCLKVAVSQIASAPTAAIFLSSWVTPPLFTTLSMASRCSLYASLPTLIKAVPVSVLSTFLERSCLAPFQQDALDLALTTEVLAGLAAALRVPDPPEAVTSLLYAATGKLYSLLPTDSHPELYRGMVECLASVPDEIFDNITLADFTPGACSVRGFFIGCCLVAHGNQPITLLNGLIDNAMNTPGCICYDVESVLAHCLWQLVELRSDTSGPMARLHWLLELLGHTRNIATGVVPLCPQKGNLNKAAELCVLVVGMAFSLLTACHPTPDFALDPFFLKVNTTSTKLTSQTKQKYLVPCWNSELRNAFLNMFPVAVLSFEHTPWDQLLPKVYDWLLAVRQVPNEVVPTDIKDHFTASLLMLRHSAEFRKPANWTKVLASM